LILQHEKVKQEDQMHPILILAAAAALALSGAATVRAPAYAQGAQQTVQLAHVDVTKTATGYRATKIIGATVVNEANDTIGKVDDIVIGTDRMPYVVLSVGGFLGVGNKLVVLPYDALSTTGHKLTMPGATKEALKALPEFKYS
jgi:ribosomal 30S subunit maturation factor RimM